MSMVEPQLVSSDRMDWETPPLLWEFIEAVFGPFDLDACATAATAKCENWLGPDHPDPARRDAFRVVPWPGRMVFCNPPYGRDISRWMNMASFAGLQSNASSVVLTFARTDTRWWHTYVDKATKIIFLKGRVPFLRDGQEVAPAPAPSVLLTFTPWHAGPPLVEFSEWR